MSCSVLHTTVILHRYLSVSLHDSSHYLSTSHQQAVLAHRTVADWRFYFCRTILAKTLDTVVHGKPRKLAISEILEPACRAATIIPCSKCLRSLVLPILTFNRTVTECLDACLIALYSKPRPCDSLSVGENHFQGDVPDKLATQCMWSYNRCKQGLKWLCFGQILYMFVLLVAICNYVPARWPSAQENISLRLNLVVDLCCR